MTVLDLVHMSMGLSKLVGSALICICEMPGSDLAKDTDCPDVFYVFLSPSKEML